MKHLGREPAIGSAPHHRSPTAVAVLGLALPVITVAVGLGALVATWADLPDPLATHWDIGGEPNGSLPAWALALLVVATTVVPAIGMVVLARRAGRAHVVRGEISSTAAACGFVAGLGASLSVITVVANRGVSSWTDAASIGLVEIGGALLVGVACGAVALAAGRALENPVSGADADGSPLPSVGLRPGERVQWIGRCRSMFAWPMIIGFGLGSAVFAIVGLASGTAAGWIVAAFLAVVALALVPFVSVRVTADRRGLRVEYGPFGWPVSTVALDQIVAASLIDDLMPTRWGGWGYRGAIRLTGKAAVVLRRGSAIRLDLASGATFAVTVDDAATGAGVLNDLAADRERA